MSDSFDFEDLAPISVPVKYAGKRYVLREATAEASRLFQNQRMRAARFTPDGKPAGVEGAADVEPLLVSLCLFEQYDAPMSNGTTEAKERSVGQKVILTWPAKVVRPLFEKALEISGLQDKEDQKALEKQFTAVVEKLVALSESDEDRAKWDAWMHKTVDEKLGKVPNGVSPEDALKNS